MKAENNPRPIKKRRPWLAALLSILCPGLGHVYSTRTKLGFQLYAFWVGLAVAIGIVMSIPPVSVAIVLLFVSIGLMSTGLMIWAVVSAFVSARRIGEVQLTRFNRLFVYGAMFAFVTGLTEVGTAKWSPFMRWESFHIPAGSMIPNLLVGDRVMSWRFAWRDRLPIRGELVVFKLPRDRNIFFVKRIVGLAGDRIQMRSGRLILNGAPVRRDETENYQSSRSDKKILQYWEILPNGRRYKIIETRGDHGELDNTKEYRVPSGHVFVLGDNRDNSADSRVDRNMSPVWIGFVPVENLYATPTIIYWAGDKGRIGLRVE